MKNKIIILAIIAVLAVVVVYYGRMSGNNSPEPTPTPTPEVSMSPMPPASVSPEPSSSGGMEHSTSPTPKTNSSPTPASSSNHPVLIDNFAYVQASITVKKGDTVTWTNKDSVGHTVTGTNGGPDSPNFSKNGTYSYTFNTVGTFSYYCKPHPWMKGTVIVTP